MTRARSQLDAPARSNVRQLCGCVIAGRRFAFDVLDVKEINVDVEITPVTHAPHGVRGLVNVRGQIYLILDLRKILDIGDPSPNTSHRVILFKEHVGPAFGILVDEIGDIISFPADDVVSGPATDSTLAAGSDTLGPVPNDLIAGICKLPDGLVVLPDVPRLLAVVRTPNPEAR